MQILSKKDNTLGYNSNFNLQDEKCNNIKMEEDECYRMPVETISCKKKHKSKRKRNSVFTKQNVLSITAGSFLTLTDSIFK